MPAKCRVRSHRVQLQIVVVLLLSCCYRHFHTTILKRFPGLTMFLQVTDDGRIGMATDLQKCK